MTTLTSPHLQLKERLGRLYEMRGDQEAWIKLCGGSLTGYIARYGHSGAPFDIDVADGGRLGDGGEAIWQADQAKLKLIEAEIISLTSKEPKHR